MSGGYFDYKQFQLTDIIEEITGILENDIELYEETNTEQFESILKNALKHISIAKIYMHRLDYFLSGDDSFESLIERLSEELNSLPKQIKNQPKGTN